MSILRGTGAKNRLVGGAFGDTLIGLGGADTLTGKSGIDKLSGGTGDDILSGGTGADKLSGEAGDDRLIGGSGNDILNGAAGNDRLSGGRGNDRLTGGGGNDVYAGGAGRDIAIVGGTSTDALIRQSGTSLVISGISGVDTIGADVELVRFADGLFAATAQTLKLTATVDTLTGGLRNDAFIALVNTQTPDKSTYSGGDVLDGGAGADTLELRIAGTGDGASTPPISLTRIETVRILNQESNGGFTSLDASLWTGVTHVVAKNGLALAGTEITSLGRLATAEMASNDSSLTIDYDEGVLAGADDVQTLILSANRGGTFEVAGGTAEMLEIVSTSAANIIELAAGETFETVRITGSQHLRIDIPIEPLNPPAVKSFDASGMTGGGVVARGLSAASGVLEIKGSLASDEFVLVGTPLESNDAIDGGGGRDALCFITGGDFTDAAFTSVQRIEDLKFDGGSSFIVTLDVQASEAGFEAISVQGDETSIDLTIGAGFERNLTVDLDAAFGAGTEPTGRPGSRITASAMQSAHHLTVLAHASSLGGDEITGGASTSDSLVLEADGGTADLSRVSNIELVRIQSGSGANAGRDIGIVMDDRALSPDTTLTIDASGESGLIDSSAQLFFDGTLETDAAFHVIGGNGDDALIGGGGADVLEGGAGGDTIDGGTGDDIIIAGVGSDTVHAGLGADTIDLGFEVGALDTDVVVFAGFASTGTAIITEFDAATGTSSEDVLRIEGVANFAQNGVLRASTAGTPGDVQLIVLDATPAGFSSMAAATIAADQLQSSDGLADRYLFVWNDPAGLAHVSLAQANASLDTSIDLATLAGVALGNIDLSDFSIV